MLTCRIVSPQRTQYVERLTKITIPAYRGEMQILTGHAETFVSVLPGDVVLHEAAGSVDRIPILGGQCHVSGNAVVIIL